LARSCEISAVSQSASDSKTFLLLKLAVILVQSQLKGVQLKFKLDKAEEINKQ